MTWFRATALVLIGAAALAVGTAAEGQNSWSARGGGASPMGAMGQQWMGFGQGGLGHVRFGHGRFARRGFGHGSFGDGSVGEGWRALNPRHGFRHRFGGRHHRFDRFDRFGRFWPGGFGIGLGWYGTGDYRDSDFFLPWSGPRAGLDNGRVVYDYDRGYPYDYYRYDKGGASDDDGASAPRCSTEWGWDSRERRDVPIRVCRQSGG